MTESLATNEPNIVVIGGGTGLFAALQGLRRHTSNLTAVVSTLDNGGSSGRLRDEFGYLPPGDVRRCLVALASEDGSALLRELFEYRFDRGVGLNGHTFGNLMLTALTDILGSEARAIHEAGQLLRIQGRVLPVTLDNATLCARLANGHEICGETDIDIRKVDHEVPIQHVFLRPTVAPNPEAIRAIDDADLVVLGPGDLYTSILPNLLVNGIADAIRASSATCVYVCNVMTKHGETDHFAAGDFIQEINRYLGGAGALRHAVINYHEQLPAELYERYRGERAEPVTIDLARCYTLVPQITVRPLIATGSLVRHDPARLAAALMEIARARSESQTRAAS
jgi:uncharacterized cofD-like protein